MFRKVLIANRGEVSVRISRTCRRLGIQSVAVYSDADAGSLQVENADSAVRLGEAPLAQSYLNRVALREAILASGADAVHPGYGLLSENADFAAEVRAAGVAFIGPETSVLRTFGDKLSARALARSLGIEPPPGTEHAVDPADARATLAEAQKVGLPLIVKAAGGGGGIGMLQIDDFSQLAAATTTCSERGRAAFGDARVYLERYLEAPRHIEVQVLCTGLGRGWTFGERECSVQRRHQKLVEESPSPAAFLDTPGARERLHAAALRLVASQPYVGLATVEFIVDRTGVAYFLEVNPRLQVEHGVTEMVWGMDLVELQLRASAGDPIEIGDDVTARGHAVEVRLYAEDPDRGFLPQPGLLERFRFPEASSHLRVETGFREGDTITPHYDPLLAKLLAHGSTRTEAIERLLRGLRATELSLRGKTGPKRTNLALLVRVLENASFRAGDYSTHLLQDLP
jgi:3-methylcrotonyl-CoA carboxylase alpha subunit